MTTSATAIAEPGPARRRPPGPAGRVRRRLLTGLVLVAGGSALAGPAVVLSLGGHTGGAAFGDRVDLGGVLGSASLDIEPGERSVPITVSALPPGDRAAGTIEVVNVGSLVLHYSLLVSPPEAELGRWLAWDLWPAGEDGVCGSRAPDGAPLDGDTLPGGGTHVVFGDPRPGADAGDRVLAPGQRELLCTAVSLPIDAPDSVQGTSITPTFVVAAEHHLKADR